MCKRRRPRSQALAAKGLASIVVAFCVTMHQAAAHEGPPFPIFMDKAAANCVVSVWADPDIGEAQFFIVVESPKAEMPVKEPRVSMWVEPVSGRLDRVTYAARRQPLRNQMQFEAEPYFDRRDKWFVGFRIEAPDGTTDELTTEVESTPPGAGAWDFALYLFPFLFLGGLWAMGMARRRKWRKHLNSAEQSEHPHADQPSSEEAVEGT